METVVLKKINRVFRLLLCVVVLGFVSTATPRIANAQFDGKWRLHRDVHRTWSVEEGLPSNSVTSFAQTRDGYLWITTHEGLARFDGMRFEVFDRASTDVFKSTQTDHAQIDQRGRLWFTIKGQGVALFNHGRFRIFGKAAGMVDNEITDLLVSSGDMAWVATDGGGLLLLSHGRFEQTTTREYLPSDRLSALARDKAGNLWIGTATEGLAVLKENAELGTFSEEDGLPSNRVLSLCATQNGEILVGTDKGLARISGDDVSVISLGSRSFTPAVTCIKEAADGMLWLGTDGNGLILQSPGGVDTYTRQDGLSFNRVEDIFFDASGGSWVATNGGGVNLFYRGQFTTYGPDDGLGSDVVLSIYEDEAGAMWFGTLGGGLSKVYRGDVQTYTTKQGLSQNNVLSVLVTPKGHIFAGTTSGGVSTCPGKPPFVPLDSIFESAQASAILKDRNGVYWIGLSVGLARMEGEERQLFFTEHGLPSDAVKALTEDDSGNLWIGTRSGLALFQDGKIVTRYRGRPLPRDPIVAIHVDEDGALWLGTYDGGLLYLGKDGSGRVTTRHGLFNDSVFSVLEDEDGNIWMSCSFGVFSAPKQRLLDVALGRAERVDCQVFGIGEGLKSREAVGGGNNVALKTRDGRLWFATIKGASVVTPGKAPRPKLQPPVHIERLVLDAKETPLGDGLVFEAGVNKVAVHYTAVGFVAPERMRFKYMLEGFDKDWIDAGIERVAHYTNLPPGDFTFRVAARSSDGIWNERGDSFSFRKKPHYYQAWWFYVGCAALLAVMVVAVVKLLVYRVKRRNKELEELVALRTQELEKRNRKLEDFALRDPLTGVRNRRFLFDVVAKDAAALGSRRAAVSGVSERRQSSVDGVMGICLLDIDDFKHFNDEYGHDIGDCVLRNVSELFSKLVRDNDVLARWGGEEFLLVLRNIHPESLPKLAKRFVDEVARAELARKNGVILRGTCSMGFVSFPVDIRAPWSVEFEQAINLASKALCYAKDNGKRMAVQAVVNPGAPTDPDVMTQLIKGLDWRYSHPAIAFLPADGDDSGAPRRRSPLR